MKASIRCINLTSDNAEACGWCGGLMKNLHKLSFSVGKIWESQPSHALQGFHLCLIHSELDACSNVNPHLHAYGDAYIFIVAGSKSRP